MMSRSETAGVAQKNQLSDQTVPHSANDHSHLAGMRPAADVSERRIRLRAAVGNCIGWIIGGLRTLFGVLTLIIGLSVLAATPILQFVVLGYLLECAGRLGRRERLRDALPGVTKAARIGAAALGIFLVTLPVVLVNSLLADARLIDSTSRSTSFLAGLSVSLGTATLLHATLAVCRGGRFVFFLRPVKNIRWLIGTLRRGGIFTGACLRSVEFAKSLRPIHYFWLGVRGFVATLLWLAIPSTLLALGPTNPLLGWLGGFLLIAVAVALPFLQVRFAVEDRWGAMFELRTVRRRFAQAPVAFLIAIWSTLLLALPLYLLKIELVPRDVVWLPSVLFVVTIVPGKMLAGWAYARSSRRETAAPRVARWACRLCMLPVAAFYVLIVFLSQYTGWDGAGGIYAHHAFLLPVPF